MSRFERFDAVREPTQTGSTVPPTHVGEPRTGEAGAAKAVPARLPGRLNPADQRALAIGRAVLALVDALGLGSRASVETYDADRLPPGVTRDAFLRRHRSRCRAGVEGWTRAGHGRVVTVDAWRADVMAETSRARRARPAPPPPTTSAVDDLDPIERALGVRFLRPAAAES